jgi:hypothetical protein
MSVAIRITPQQMSHADYEQMIGELEAAGVHEPEGRTFHAAYGGDEVHIFEVWDSAEQFDAHQTRVADVLEGAGFDGGTVEVHDLHAQRYD